MSFSSSAVSSLITIDSVEPHHSQVPFLINLYEPEFRSEQHRLQLRDNSISSNVSVDGLGYLIQVSIGTPRQNVRMVLSTTSPLFMVVDQSSTICDAGLCLVDRVFRSGSSSTYQPQSNYTASQESGLVTTGSIAKESFVVGGTAFSDVSVLVANGGNMSRPMLGLGCDGAVNTTANYSSLLSQMYSRGTIGYWGYSLSLDHANATTPGHLLLGSVNTAKFDGKLEVLPITRSDPRYGHFTIPLSSMAFWDGTTNHVITGSAFEVVPEVGTSALILPTSIVQQLVRLLGATYTGVIYQYAAGKFNESATIDLLFGSTLIKIPLNDIWYGISADTASLNLFDVKGTPTVGLPFFRNAYTVFDYARNEFGIASLKHNTTSDVIVPMTTRGVGGLPGFVPSTSGSNQAHKALGLILGLSIGLGVPMVLILAALTFLWRRRKTSRSKSTTGRLGRVQQVIPWIQPKKQSKAQAPVNGTKSNITVTGIEIPLTQYYNLHQPIREQAVVYLNTPNTEHSHAVASVASTTGLSMSSGHEYSTPIQSTRPVLRLNTDIFPPSPVADNREIRRKPVPST